jgi:hypothetical protein
MKKLIWLAGAVVLLSGTGCRSWCDRMYGAPHQAATQVQGAPCCVPVQQQRRPAVRCPRPARRLPAPTLGSGQDINAAAVLTRADALLALGDLRVPGYIGP